MKIVCGLAWVVLGWVAGGALGQAVSAVGTAGQAAAGGGGFETHGVTGFPVVSVVDGETIAGRAVQLDSAGKLLPWPVAGDTGFSYADYFLSQWTIDWAQFQGQRLQYFYCCFDFDRTSYEMKPDTGWANSTGYLRAMSEGFVERLYPYTGDARTVEYLENFFDYEMAHGLTPADYAYASVPYASGDPGAADYRGWSSHGVDFIEPHVVGEDGYAYLRLYEMTGETKYLREAILCADALVKNFKKGDAVNSPWPYRCHGKDGSLKEGKGMFPYSANVVEPIELFDELIRLKQGDVGGYARVRAGAWDWLMAYPMKTNVWVGYFEDVPGSMEDMNNVIPLELARYVLLHPEKDAMWREHAKALVEWVKATPRWPKYLVHGAMVTTEQGSGGKDYCCNLPGQCCDSHSARLAAVEAFYYAATGEEAYREEAYRTDNWVTYWQGLPGGAHAPFSEQWWFTDEFADGPRRMMDAFWAVPEWAPGDESHVVGSSSVVTKVGYGAGRVTWSTFDKESRDVLRLNFVPEVVSVGGRAVQRVGRVEELKGDGYWFDEATRVLRVAHASSREVDVDGMGPAVVRLVTFDDPQLAVGTVLRKYPEGLVEWGAGEWTIAAPGGKFGTFHLRGSGEFKFVAPRVFAGVDVFNGGAKEAVVTFAAEGMKDLVVKVGVGELKRVRTGWSGAVSGVTVEVKGEGVGFDNLGWGMP
jgi:hypothetical protein